MDIVGNSHLQRRAALHAALADPARLAIVDALALGDASPSELQALVGLPSKLLAHHLKVLESEGIVTRSRSEGDRRRTYLRLVPGSLDAVLPGAPNRASRVVFICTTTPRAPTWRRRCGGAAAACPSRPRAPTRPNTSIRVRSRSPPDTSSRCAGFALARSKDVLRPDDLIITVCDTAHEELGGPRGLHGSVPDPVPVGSDEAFDAAFAQLTRRVGDLAPRLTAN